MYSILIAAVMTAFLVSFTCSLLEAAYLSITPSQLADIHQRNQQMGKMVAEQKEHIEKTIAVVLISNTAAHTIGAAIAGAQFDNIFGDNWLWLFSLIFVENGFKLRLDTKFATLKTPLSFPGFSRCQIKRRLSVKFARTSINLKKP